MTFPKVWLSSSPANLLESKWKVFGILVLSSMVKNSTSVEVSVSTPLAEHLSVRLTKKFRHQYTNHTIGPPTKFIHLGYTEIPEEIFMEFLREISSRFTQETYHVFKHNCNNFTNECSSFLIG
jgi:hypothetical protein